MIPCSCNRHLGFFPFYKEEIEKRTLDTFFFNKPPTAVHKKTEIGFSRSAKNVCYRLRNCHQIMTCFSKAEVATCELHDCTSLLVYVSLSVGSRPSIHVRSIYWLCRWCDSNIWLLKTRLSLVIFTVEIKDMDIENCDSQNCLHNLIWSPQGVLFFPHFFFGLFSWSVDIWKGWGLLLF